MTCAVRRPAMVQEGEVSYTNFTFDKQGRDVFFAPSKNGGPIFFLKEPNLTHTHTHTPSPTPTAHRNTP